MLKVEIKTCCSEDSTGMDCFGSFHVKIGRHTEKRSGIIFKFLTTRAVHLDVLTSIDSDAFLMAVLRFTACHCTPAELYSVQGSNFRGGEEEFERGFFCHESCKDCW